MVARLQAQDLEDLKIVSAMLQDAAIRVGDIAWLPKRRRFAFGGSRFMWEAQHGIAPDGNAPDGKAPDGKAPGGTAASGEDGAAKPARIGFGAHVDSVLSVASRGIARDRPDDVLVLLAVTAEGPEEESPEGGGGAISLIFAGGSAITLRVECIDMSLADLGTSYATRLKPDHDLDSDPDR